MSHGGILAVNIRSGKVRWKTSNAQRPLFVSDDVLIAQSESEEPTHILHLLRLDAHTGKPRGMVAVGLPARVRALIDDGPSESFRVEAWPTPGGVNVAWRYVSSPVPGAEPDPEAPTRAWSDDGMARVNFATGSIAHTDIVERSKPPPPLPPPLARLEASGSLPQPFWRSRSVYATVSRRTGGTEGQWFLRRWDGETGAPLPDVPIGTKEDLQFFPSVDTEHLLASRAVPNSTRSRFEWRVFAFETGELLGELAADFVSAAFFVSDRIFVHEVPARTEIAGGVRVESPRRIRAVDLRSDEQRWALPIRDTLYRGPIPQGGESGRLEGSADRYELTNQLEGNTRHE